MRSPVLLALSASLLAAGCNLADGQRDTAANDRAAMMKRERSGEAEDRKREARKPVRKLEDADYEPQAQPAASTAADPSAVSRAWFAGRWTDTGDCAQAGLFSPDGTFNLADGARGMWNIRNGRLVVQGAGERREVELRRIDQDTVEVVNDDGTAGRSIRC